MALWNHESFSLLKLYEKLSNIKNLGNIALNIYRKNRTCFPQTFSHIVAKGLLLTLHLKRTVSNPWSTGKKHIQILLNNRATSYKLIEADEFTFSKFTKFVRR